MGLFSPLNRSSSVCVSRAGGRGYAEGKLRQRGLSGLLMAANRSACGAPGGNTGIFPGIGEATSASNRPVAGGAGCSLPRSAMRFTADAGNGTRQLRGTSRTNS